MSDLRQRAIEVLRARGPLHSGELRALLGYPCPIEYSMMLVELVEDGIATKNPPEVMLPRYALAAEAALP